MNNHINDITRDISNLTAKLQQKQAVLHFIEAHPTIFTNEVYITDYENTITIYGASAVIEAIAKTWGQQNWRRVPAGDTGLSWKRDIDGFDIILNNMESCTPTLVPLNAWPIMLEERNN